MTSKQDLSSILDNVEVGLTPEQTALLYDRVMQLVVTIKSSFIELSKWIWIIKTHHLWLEMGFATQEEFINDLVEESQISRTDFFEMNRVYEELVIKYAIPEEDVGDIGLRKAGLITKQIARDDNISGAQVDELMERARYLTYNHLELEMREARGETTPAQKIIGIMSTEILVKFLKEIMGAKEVKNWGGMIETLLQLKRVRIFRDLEVGFLGIEKI